MIVRHAQWIGPAIAGGCVIAQITALLLVFASGAYVDPYSPALIGFPIVGAIIVARQRTNAIGWILVLGGAAVNVGWLCAAIVFSTIESRADPTTAQRILAWIANMGFVNGLVGMLILMAFLFPTGRFLSPRWRMAGGVALTILLILQVSEALDPGPLANLFDPDSHLENPFGISAVGTLRSTFAVAGLLMGVGFALIGLGAVVQRVRTARGIERVQIQWLALGLAATAIGAIISALGSVLLPDDYRWLATAADYVVFLSGTLGISIAIGIAILRYQLYDIERLVSRTIVYLTLTATLALVYVVMVLLLGGLMRSLTGESSSLVTAASTLAAAALFRPLRGRFQGFVDRRFYRRRYDAARLVSAFSAAMTHEFDLETLDAELRRVVHETMHPAHISLWLRPDGPR